MSAQMKKWISTVLVMVMTVLTVLSAGGTVLAEAVQGASTTSLVPRPRVGYG